MHNLHEASECDKFIAPILAILSALIFLRNVLYIFRTFHIFRVVLNGMLHLPPHLFQAILPFGNG